MSTGCCTRADAQGLYAAARLPDRAAALPADGTAASGPCRRGAGAQPRRRIAFAAVSREQQIHHARTASYEADPERGPPRPAALLRRPRHERDAEVDPGPLRRRGRVPDRQPRPARRGLRGDRGQGAPARRASRCHVVDAREEFAREYLVPAIKANAIYGGGYPLFTALGRPLIAKLAVEHARAQRLRHDRPRLHRQGQRPGPHRGHDRDARAGAEGDRAGALVADGARGGDRLRARARHPGQGRHRGRALLDRRQPLGALLGGPLDRGPRPRPRGRRLPARHAARAGARRGRDDRARASSAGVPVALDGERARARRADRSDRRDRRPPRRRHHRPHRGPHRRPEGARHLRGARRDGHPARPPGARAARLHDPPEPVQAASSTASGPTSSTRGCGGSRCATTSTPTWTASTSASPARSG